MSEPNPPQPASRAPSKPAAPRALKEKLARAAQELVDLRCAASPRHSLADLAAQRCAACCGQDLVVCRYPAFRSPIFAGQLLCQCRDCGLAWVPNTELDLAAFYEGGYAAAFSPERIYDGPFYGPDNPIWQGPKTRPHQRAETHAQLVARFGPLGRVLDLGAGVGFFLRAVAADEKYACELDPNGARILTEELGVTLLPGPEARQDFFDLVVASHVLEHFTYLDLPKILAHVWRALHPGGVFLIEVPTGAEQLDAFSAGRRGRKQRLEPHTLFFSSDAMLRFLHAAGFEMLEVPLCAWTVRASGQGRIAGLGARLGAAETHETVCQCRSKIPQKCRSNFPHFRDLVTSQIRGLS
jgi:SAM-dependent methyltransferase